MTEPLLTALVSTYASERHLRGCLDSLLAQTLGDKLEIVVVDACSPEGEGAIVREYQARHQNLRYVRTAVRENSSLSFTRGTALARGRYLTTANADDRHRPDFAERLVAVLEQHPEFGIAYADSLITTHDNETFAANSAQRRYAWPDYTATTALSCCLFGAQPVWRRAVHERVGTWDPDCNHANDQDMFLRIALRFGAVHVRETLGLFLMRPDSVSGADNRGRTLAEVLSVLRRYRTGTSLPELFPGLSAASGDPMAAAAAWIELGNLCALGPYTDAEFALVCYQRAVGQPLRSGDATAVRRAFANNSACILAAAGQWAAAGRALDLCGKVPTTARNRAELQAARECGAPPPLRAMQFVELPHPVVTASRTTRSVTFAADGSLQWSSAQCQRPWDVYDGPNGVPVTPAERVWSLPQPVPSAAPAASVVAPTSPHVLLVMYGWSDSGGGTMLPRHFAREVAARGHRVSVLYAAAQPAPHLPAYAVMRHEEDGVHLFGICNRPSTFMDLQQPEREVDDPAVLVRFTALLDELRPDVVHFWNLHNLGMSLPSECKRRNLPTVLSSNNYWTICPRLYLVSERLERCAGSSDDGAACERCLGTPGSAAAHAARKAAGISMLRADIDVHLAVSSRVRDLYVQNGDDPGHVRVLRQEPPDVAAIWRQVGAVRRPVEHLQRPLRVGFFGSVMAHKGVHVLAEALQMLPDDAVECVALGDVAPDYRVLLQRLDRTGRLHCTGRYDPAKLPQLLAKFDVVVVPSVWDDCAPFVVAEALAARCPVVGSAIGGIPDFVRHGENGLLFPAGDARQLAACLHAFGGDPTLLGRLQRGIEAPRGLPAFVDDVFGVYSELLASPACVG
jgi:glycosyltransferase involved in cell wall biosynthesis